MKVAFKTYGKEKILSQTIDSLQINSIIMAIFSIGQVVRLKSGGPEMTVSNIIDSENPGHWALYVNRWKAENPNAKVWYQTQWFQGTALKKDVFMEEILSAVE